MIVLNFIVFKYLEEIIYQRIRKTILNEFRWYFRENNFNCTKIRINQKQY